MEERWEDASPAAALHRRRARGRARAVGAARDRGVEQAGHPSGRCDITLPTHHDARAFAERLRARASPSRSTGATCWSAPTTRTTPARWPSACAPRPRRQRDQVEGNGLAYWRMLTPTRTSAVRHTSAAWRSSEPARWRSGTAHTLHSRSHERAHRRARESHPLRPRRGRAADLERWLTSGLFHPSRPRGARARTTRSRSRRRTSPARCTWATRSTARSRTC